MQWHAGSTEIAGSLISSGMSAWIYFAKGIWFLVINFCLRDATAGREGMGITCFCGFAR